MKEPSGKNLVAFACFACRKSFKRQRNLHKLVRACPNCAGLAVDLGRKFKPPRTDDLDAWSVVKFLYENGFPFLSIGKAYPLTIKEAKDFVIVNAASKLRSISVPVRRDHPVKSGRSEVIFVNAPWVPYENPRIENLPR